MIRPYSPVNHQDFIWFGEYADGTNITEFDLSTKQPQSFQSIRRKDLIRFGLVGQGITLHHEVYGGDFKLNGQPISFLYKEGSEEYMLSGQMIPYNDVITYKNAEAFSVLVHTDTGGDFFNQITQYNSGYKSTMQIKGVTFNFKALVCIPYNQPSYMSFRLVADKKLDGEFIVRRNGLEQERFKAPLDVGVGGELNWIIKG